jgi:tetraacyldisaccharide 4'-kinase
VEARVVSIGNITAGGTGKTPATIHFAREFHRESKRVVVLSRGYGRTTPMDDPLAVSDTSRILVSQREAGDEPFLIARKVPGAPVVVCGDRVKGARFAIEKFGAEVIVLDDGFQHVSLARDEDIVVIDCTEPFGYGHLLPRGLLREPLSGLKRATRFLLTRTDERDPTPVIGTLSKINPTAGILKSRHRPVRLLTMTGDGEMACEWLAGKTALAVSSIGNPKAFEETLERLGARVIESLRFKDHHWYDYADGQTIEATAARVGADCIVSTEKDGVRLTAMPKPPANVLLLEVELELLP